MSDYFLVNVLAKTSDFWYGNWEIEGFYDPKETTQLVSVYILELVDGKFMCGVSGDNDMSMSKISSSYIEASQDFMKVLGYGDVSIDKLQTLGFTGD